MNITIKYEQLDIINEQNEVVCTVGKSVAHRDDLLHRIVIGEMVNAKGEYCFVKQAQAARILDIRLQGHVGAENHQKMRR
jgi:hypothetical protein